MALYKQKEDIYGNSGIKYWRIIETNIDWANRQSHITLAGYVDKQARMDGKQPLECVSFDWNGDDFPFSINVLDQEGENIVRVAYEKIKESKLDEDGNETNWFVDAEDI